MVNFCELCGSVADFHCAADSAFLCHSCDAKFHTSNFLFARHFRRIICPICKSLTRDFVSGPLLPWPPMTSCCATSSPSSASSCCSELSSTPAVETNRKRKTRSRGKDDRVKAVANGIFVDWCDKLGLNGDFRNTVLSLASFALTVERRRRNKEAKKNVFLAAAFWFGVKNSRKTMTCPTLNKVEDVTGIAAGMIRAVESKLARAVTLQLKRWRMDSEEGWAENDSV